jgi:hypothetical protein
VPQHKLGLGKSKVLILRIPVEWWDQLERLHAEGHPPARDLIRDALGAFLRKVKPHG